MDDPIQAHVQTASTPVRLLYFESGDQWRDWLAENGQKESEAWLVFYRKAAGRPSLGYGNALD